MDNILLRTINHLINQVEQSELSGDIEYLNSRILLLIELLIEDL